MCFIVRGPFAANNALDPLPSATIPLWQFDGKIAAACHGGISWGRSNHDQ
jgi:hypothetical protein